jgi:hypothetical protein
MTSTAAMLSTIYRRRGQHVSLPSRRQRRADWRRQLRHRNDHAADNFFQGGSPKTGYPTSPPGPSSTARNRFRPNFRGWRLDEFSIFARPPPSPQGPLAHAGTRRIPSDGRCRAGPLNLPRPGRTTYLPRPRRRRLRCRRPRKGGRHAVRCSGLRQTWPPSCARSCRPPELL